MNKEELSRFFTEQPGWLWLSGMLATKHIGIGMTTQFVVTSAYGEWLYHSGDDRSKRTLCLPDLTDPATIGCIVQLVADAHGCNLNDVSVVRTTGGVWSVWIHTSSNASHRVATHLPSRVEALAMALQGGGEK